MYPQYVIDRIGLKWKDVFRVGPIGNMFYLGYARRFVKYSQKENYDHYFASYCHLIGYEFKEQYGIAKGNSQASYNAILKYDIRQPKYDNKAGSIAYKMLVQSYAVVKKARLLVDYEKVIVKKSSPGYPWSLFYKTRRDAMAHSDVMLYVREFVKSTADRVVLNCHIIKREPKKKNKIIKNDLRGIMPAPMELTCKGIYLFGEMDDNIIDAGRQLRIASLVGLSKYRQGWNAVYRRLNKHPNAMDFDFTGFDKSIDRLSIKVCMNLRLGLFAQLDARLIEQVKCYYRYMQNAIIVMEDGNVLYKRSGNSSGQPLTIFENNIVNEFRWLYAWAILAPDETWHTFRQWKNHVELCVMGDDSILTVSDEVKSWYNPRAIVRVFAHMGWANKFGDVGFKKLDDTEFCSLIFRKLPSGMVVPQIKYTDKLMTSMLRGSDYTTILYSCLRALAIRMDAYYNDEIFRVMDGYVRYLFENYMDELQAGGEGISFVDLIESYKTIPQLDALYTSRSSCP